MKIYTYHRNDLGWRFDNVLMDLWKDSWLRQGFEPIVLGKLDAAVHPRFIELGYCPRLFDSTLSYRYLQACYERWMAYALRGDPDSSEPILAGELDVVNYGVTPDDIRAAWQTVTDNVTLGEKYISFGGGPTPSLIYGTPAAYQAVVSAFFAFSAVPFTSSYLQRDGVSDQNILDRRRDLWMHPKIPLVTELLSENWETAKAVHYPMYRMPPPHDQRGAQILQLRPI